MKAKETDKIKGSESDDSAVEEVEKSEEIAQDQDPEDAAGDHGKESAKAENELTIEELLEQSRKEKEDLYLVVELPPPIHWSGV